MGAFDVIQKERSSESSSSRGRRRWGFTLEEIQGLLALDERKACMETRRIAVHKLELIEQKIADLSKIRKALTRLVRSCDESAAGVPCPIIHLLTDD
jgi:MerR family mercuric resistance operon transcriptional regulator